MARLKLKLDEAKAEPKGRPFAPAGQSTQMIVGADASDDRAILATSANLYGSYGLKRVYYSAFSPIPDASPHLPLIAPPLMREHRLYQADWLLRFYGFDVSEIAEDSGMLALDMDPKLAWALRHRERFPVDVNRAPRELLLRVPGLGTKAVDAIIASRRHMRVRAEDLRRMRVPWKRVAPFVAVPESAASARLLDRADLASRMRAPHQLSLPLQ